MREVARIWTDDLGRISPNTGRSRPLLTRLLPALLPMAFPAACMIGDLPTRSSCPFGARTAARIPASLGWSPQWLAVLVPLVLPSMPYPKGALYSIALTSVVILEWPVSLSRGRFDLLWTTTAMQTLVLVVLTVDAWRTARSESSASHGVGSE